MSFVDGSSIGIYPIHIVVKNSRAMLHAVVDSAADRQIAEVRAREIASSPQCRPLLRRRVRSRCDACFARFPQVAMLHHRRAWPRVRSTKRSVQGERSHAFTCVKSSPQIKSAMAVAIGSSRVSGERQRLSNRHMNCDCPRRWPRSIAILTERLVTREHTVQGLDFLHCVLPQRVASVFLHERAKPFAQGPGLRRHSVEFSWDGALLKACTHGGRYQAGGGEPRQEILARFNPLHRSVDWCRDRIEKIEGAGVRNEKR